MKTNSLAIAITFIVLLFSANLACGFQTDINPDIEMTCQGIVKCSTSQNPIKYVNIGIMGKGIGTVSGPDGLYSLELDPLYNKDTLMFSCIGYQSCQKPRMPCPFYPALRERPRSSSEAKSPKFYRTPLIAN
ncbi:MAG: hypothetical protein EA361_15165 [Bacteroidetes bacterium]|nr:MAG: hypothetical protein EA361_15165 [Bacteroidota bacterium]